MGFIADQQTLDWAFKSETSPQVSAIEYQLGILEALTTNGAETFIVSTLPIASYPKSRILFVKGRPFVAGSAKVSGRLLGYVNLDFIKLLCRFISMLVYGSYKVAGPKRCDSIIVYSIHAPHLLAAIVLKAIFGVRVAVFINDLPIYMGAEEAQGAHETIKRLETRIARWLMGKADIAFPVSVKTAQDWLPRSLPYVVIEAIAPSGRIRPKRFPKHETAVSGHVPRLLYTGTFSYILGFARLFSENRDIRAQLIFVGGGPDEAGLREFAADDPRIVIKSFMSGEELEREIEACDFLVNARRSDWPGGRYSFAFKLFDYMMRGRPILSTRLGSITEDYFRCFLPIDDGDAQEFKRSMETALATAEDDLCDRVRIGLDIVKIDKAPVAVGKSMLEALYPRRNQPASETSL